MAFLEQYKAKLTDCHSAVERIGSNSIVSIGQAVCQPPALMDALASRAAAGDIDNVRLYYMHAEQNMQQYRRSPGETADCRSESTHAARIRSFFAAHF